MPIDQSFFPSIGCLTTYVDDSPRFTRKQLVVLGPSSNDLQALNTEDDDTVDLKQQDPELSIKDKKFQIEKIYHAQCLENYPNQFAAFVKLSIVNISPQLDQPEGDQTLLCLAHYK